jgi:hypothetical protein
MKRMLWSVGIRLVNAVVVTAQSPQTPRRVASQTQVEEIYVVPFLNPKSLQQSFVLWQRPGLAMQSANKDTHFGRSQLTRPMAACSPRTSTQLGVAMGASGELRIR